MTDLVIGVVDVFVVRPLSTGWRVLALKRSVTTRCPGAWEAIHGRIEHGERPEEAAVREVREETGLEVARLYNVTVHPFYVQSTGAVQLAVVFTAFVAERSEVRLGPEHETHAWLTVEEALTRLAWPRERSTLRDAYALLHRGHAGEVDDVLRVI